MVQPKFLVRAASWRVTDFDPPGGGISLDYIPPAPPPPRPGYALLTIISSLPLLRVVYCNDVYTLLTPPYAAAGVVKYNYNNYY